ncbi:MAG: hypothetical protein DWQ45_03545 [Planctomycetota bacterium]|nr:MAG: hypothetical protein DWQ41_16910 [Planctomycetota bacterium]REK38929.1 MAG: hypothetical protein DWQ45_03545 [Planctomycetota bacterium]
MRAGSLTPMFQHQRISSAGRRPFTGRLGLHCAQLIVLLLLAALLPPRQAASQESQSGTIASSRGENGPGLQFRTGHNAFRTFGRHESITHAELFPYVLDGNQMLFGDLRLFLSNNAEVGGNAGLGYRIRPWGGNQIFGASLWYDADNSLGVLYQGVGLSLEGYTDIFDVRLNGYAPVGKTEQNLVQRAINTRFVGTSLVFDRVTLTGKSMPGVDYEFGVALPTALLKQHNLRWYVGGYNFAASGADAINGFKTRLKGSVVPSVDTQVEFTTDGEFGTNVMLGLAWTYFGGFEREQTSRSLNYDRMSEFVRRNYNVIVGRQRDVDVGVMAISAATGSPFVIQHIGPGGNSTGAPDDPWGTLADAQVAGGDVYLVHAGTVLTDPIVLNPGEVLLGQGAGLQQFLDVEGLGHIMLPHVGAGTARPIIQGVAGDAVTLASDTVFAGFTIDSPTGAGIVGNGVSNVLIGNVDILTPGGDGVSLTNPDGQISILNTDVIDASGVGFSVDGGTADVRFNGSITNQAGRALVIDSTTDGTIDFTGASLEDDGGDGVLLTDVDGDVILDNVTVLNATGVGIEASGGDGNIAFLSTTTVDSASATGILVDDREGATLFAFTDVTAAVGETAVLVSNSPGDTWFTRLDATSDSATAFKVTDSGEVGVGGGTLDAADASAIDVENADMNLTFDEVNSDNATAGIRLVDATGVFVAKSGLISDSDTGFLLQNVETVGIVDIEFTDNDLGVDAENVDHLAFTNIEVTGSTSHGVKMLNVRQFLAFNSEVSESGGPGEAALLYEVDQLDDYIFSLSQSTIESDVGNGLEFRLLAGAEDSSLNLSLEGNFFTTTADSVSAVSLDWDGAVQSRIFTNGFNIEGDHSTAFLVTNASTTDLTQVSMGQNIFLLAGDHGTAGSFTTAGRSALVIGVNQAVFDGTGNVGFDFDLAESAEVALFSNQVTDDGGAGTGFLFSSLDGPSTILIEDNRLDFLGPAAVIDEGIIFQSITDQITLQGTQNNIITGATTPFFAPGGSTTGRIRINGVFVP